MTFEEWFNVNSPVYTTIIKQVARMAWEASREAMKYQCSTCGHIVGGNNKADRCLSFCNFETRKVVNNGK